MFFAGLAWNGIANFFAKQYNFATTALRTKIGGFPKGGFNIIKNHRTLNVEDKI
jgi:hypothetical protein